MKSRSEQTDKKSRGPVETNDQLTVLSELLKDTEDKQWYLDELNKGGPEHKQILSLLLLERINGLVKRVSEMTGEHFTPQPGIELSKEYSTGTYPFPIAIPLSAVLEQDGKMLSHIQQSPDHELLAYLTAIQAMTWAINTLKQV